MTMLDTPDTAGIASALLGWLSTYAIHSTVLLLAAWLVTARAKSHLLKDALWKTALFAGFFTATGQALLRLDPVGGRLVVSERAPAARPAADPVFVEASGAIAAPPAVETDPAEPSAAFRSSGPALGARQLAVLGWAFIAAALLAIYALRWMRFSRRLAGRRLVMTHPLAAMLERLAAEAGFHRPIRLSTSAEISSPVALGSSEIAIPEAALTELDPDQQRGMLAHELAHLDRRDPVWLALASVAERVGFFQPLNRLARRRIQESAEYLCDEWAVHRTGTGVFLAKCLAKVAEWMDASPRALPVAGMAEERSHLVARVRRLLEGAPFPRAPGRRALAMTSLLTVAGAVAVVPGVSFARHQASGGAESVVSPTDPADPAEGIRVSQDSTRAIIRALTEALRDPDLEVRRAAIRSLSRYKDQGTAPAFREALRDPDAEIRAAAIEGLVELRDRGAADAIIGALRDESPEVRRHAAEALSEIRTPASRDALLAALRDSDAEVRARAASSLGEHKDPAAAAGLSAALKDSNGDVRAHAIDALAEMELASAPPGVLEALNDPSAEVRHRAAHALGHYQDPRAVPSLRALLDDPNADVREAAVEALGEIRTDAAREALMAALKSRDPKVRKAAADALGQRSEG